MDDTYTIRPYEAVDREGFKGLFETVFDEAFSDEAFEWKFERNPHAPATPIVIAESAGEVVGARAFLAHRIRANDRTALALQGTDAMVHPDHRRQGVYGKLVEYTTEYYAGRDETLRFTFPNQVSLPGNLKGGARLAGTVASYYRIQNPIALLGTGATTVARLANRLSKPTARRCLGAWDRLASTAETSVRTRRHTDVPAEVLEALHERSVPDALHTVRDAAFFRWRFGNPEWEYTTYTAVRGETVVSSITTGTRRREGITETRLTDALPMGGGVRSGALASLLDAVVADHRDSDVIAAFGDGVPHELLSRRGFLSDHGPILSRVSSPSPMVVSLLSTDERTWQVNGFDAADRSNWMLSYCDWDVS